MTSMAASLPGAHPSHGLNHGHASRHAHHDEFGSEYESIDPNLFNWVKNKWRKSQVNYFFARNHIYFFTGLEMTRS